jgi:hypothetical protein
MSRSRAVAAALAALTVTLLIVAVHPAPRANAVEAARGWIDTTNRAEVAKAYLATFGPAVPAPAWTGNVATCNAGTISAGHRAAMMSRVNWYRAMAGVLDGVVEDAQFTTDAQNAALITAANNTLNHNPPTTATCYSASGANGANNSNLALGNSGASGVESIELYMNDPGASNAAVGHRSWILEPNQVRMGPASIPNQSGALYVIDPPNLFGPNLATRDSNRFVSWPPAGFVPNNKVYARFSLHNNNADFTNATVTVTVNGSPVTTTIEHKGAPGPNNNRPGPDIVFDPALPAFGASDVPITITVSGITGAGLPSTYSWTTTVIPPPTSVPASGQAIADFDGDHKTDVSVFRPGSATWFVHPSGGSVDTGVNYGTSTDLPVPADYDGDGKTDIAVFRPSTGLWAIHRSSGGPDTLLTYGGLSGDVPVPADYDGDGKADIAVFRPSTGTWFIHRSTGGDTAVTFGTGSDIPVPADYDGDGKADVAMFRPSGGTWYVHPSTGAPDSAVSYGASGDVPVVGDYDGDGKTDIAIFRRSTGLWAVSLSSDGDTFVTYGGIGGDIPVPGDYDGDGKTDIGIFRPSTGAWYERRSGTNTDAIVTFGIASDIPLPLPTPVRIAIFG